jgi:intein/homing endonuclease
MEKEATLLGLHAGDGTLYRTSTGVVWELRGSREEKAFYDGYVTRLLRASEYRFSAGFRSGGKSGCYGVRSCDRELIGTLLDAGFPLGKKSLTVSVPESVLSGTLAKKRAFLQGLFATDGSAFLTHANHSHARIYPRVELSSASRGLRDRAKDLITEFGIRSTCWTYTSKRGHAPMHFVRVAGVEQVAAFVHRIGLINPKHRRALRNV